MSHYVIQIRSKHAKRESHLYYTMMGFLTELTHRATDDPEILTMYVSPRPERPRRASSDSLRN